MRPRQMLLVVTLASALAASAVLPPDHLHRSTAAHAQIIHAHWEFVEHPATPAAFSAHDDDHDNAVVLDTVMATGPSSYVPSQPAALPQPIWVAAVTSAEVFPPESDTASTPSPPPRPTVPRGPPA